MTYKLTTTLFFNYCFDKRRFQSFLHWFFKKNYYGQSQLLRFLEKLKFLGFHSATQAGFSISIEDLKIPYSKSVVLSNAENNVLEAEIQMLAGNLTQIERYQRIIEIWNRTSENLKLQVLQTFQFSNLFNPVYLMAFSGARGNISQIRQLVGMRGLMANPQGQIIDFPIRSNFREGLTLTEYLISCSGARKGIVDTALRTAASGYLTRRLVDVAHHVIISQIDCQPEGKNPLYSRKDSSTNVLGIVLEDLYDRQNKVLSLHQRLIGRILAENIISPETSLIIGEKNKEISQKLSQQICNYRKKVLVRSPLTCQSSKFICQLCYGWNLAEGQLVSIGEAVGVLAAQAIGEPGTQLTMRTFHTGGVFTGILMDQIYAPFSGTINYPVLCYGILIRTQQGKIAYLSKKEGNLIIVPEIKTGSRQLKLRKKLLSKVHNKNPFNIQFDLGKEMDSTYSKKQLSSEQPEGNISASQPEGHKGMSRRDARRECPVGAHLEETPPEGDLLGHSRSQRRPIGAFPEENVSERHNAPTGTNLSTRNPAGKNPARKNCLIKTPQRGILDPRDKMAPEGNAPWGRQKVTNVSERRRGYPYGDTFWVQQVKNSKYISRQMDLRFVYNKPNTVFQSNLPNNWLNIPFWQNLYNNKILLYKLEKLSLNLKSLRLFNKTWLKVISQKQANLSDYNYNIPNLFVLNFLKNIFKSYKKASLSLNLHQLEPSQKKLSRSARRSQGDISERRPGGAFQNGISQRDNNVSKRHKATETPRRGIQGQQTKTSIKSQAKYCLNFQSSTLLYTRQGEKIVQTQLIAEIPYIDYEKSVENEQEIVSSLSGEIHFENFIFIERTFQDFKTITKISENFLQSLSEFWILFGQSFKNFLIKKRLIFNFLKKSDLIDRLTPFTQISIESTNLLQFSKLDPFFLKNEPIQLLFSNLPARRASQPEENVSKRRPGGAFKVTRECPNGEQYLPKMPSGEELRMGGYSLLGSKSHSKKQKAISISKNGKLKNLQSNLYLQKSTQKFQISFIFFKTIGYLQTQKNYIQKLSPQDITQPEGGYPYGVQKVTLHSKELNSYKKHSLMPCSFWLFRKNAKNLLNKKFKTWNIGLQSHSKYVYKYSDNSNPNLKLLIKNFQIQLKKYNNYLENPLLVSYNIYPDSKNSFRLFKKQKPIGDPLVAFHTLKHKNNFFLSDSISSKSNKFFCELSSNIKQSMNFRIDNNFKVTMQMDYFFQDNLCIFSVNRQGFIRSFGQTFIKNLKVVDNNRNKYLSLKKKEKYLDSSKLPYLGVPLRGIPFWQPARRESPEGHQCLEETPEGNVSKRPEGNPTGHRDKGSDSKGYRFSYLEKFVSIKTSLFNSIHSSEKYPMFLTKNVLKNRYPRLLKSPKNSCQKNQSIIIEFKKRYWYSKKNFRKILELKTNQLARREKPEGNVSSPEGPEGNPTGHSRSQIQGFKSSKGVSSFCIQKIANIQLYNSSNTTEIKKKWLDFNLLNLSLMTNNPIYKTLTRRSPPYALKDKKIQSIFYNIFFKKSLFLQNFPKKWFRQKIRYQSKVIHWQNLSNYKYLFLIVVFQHLTLNKDIKKQNINNDNVYGTVHIKDLTQNVNWIDFYKKKENNFSVSQPEGPEGNPTGHRDAPKGHSRSPFKKYHLWHLKKRQHILNAKHLKMGSYVFIRIFFCMDLDFSKDSFKSIKETLKNLYVFLIPSDGQCDLLANPLQKKFQNFTNLKLKKKNSLYLCPIKAIQFNLFFIILIQKFHIKQSIDILPFFQYTPLKKQSLDLLKNNLIEKEPKDTFTKISFLNILIKQTIECSNKKVKIQKNEKVAFGLKNNLLSKFLINGFLKIFLFCIKQPIEKSQKISKTTESKEQKSQLEGTVSASQPEGHKGMSRRYTRLQNTRVDPMNFTTRKFPIISKNFSSNWIKNKNQPPKYFLKSRNNFENPLTVESLNFMNNPLIFYTKCKNNMQNIHLNCQDNGLAFILHNLHEKQTLDFHKWEFFGDCQFMLEKRQYSTYFKNFLQIKNDFSASQTGQKGMPLGGARRSPMSRRDARRECPVGAHLEETPPEGDLLGHSRSQKPLQFKNKKWMNSQHSYISYPRMDKVINKNSEINIFTANQTHKNQSTKNNKLPIFFLDKILPQSIVSLNPKVQKFNILKNKISSSKLQKTILDFYFISYNLILNNFSFIKNFRRRFLHIDPQKPILNALKYKTAQSSFIEQLSMSSLPKDHLQNILLSKACQTNLISNIKTNIQNILKINPSSKFYKEYISKKSFILDSINTCEPIHIKNLKKYSIRYFKSQIIKQKYYLFKNNPNLFSISDLMQKVNGVPITKINFTWFLLLFYQTNKAHKFYCCKLVFEKKNLDNFFTINCNCFLTTHKNRKLFRSPFKSLTLSVKQDGFSPDFLPETIQNGYKINSNNFYSRDNFKYLFYNKPQIRDSKKLQFKIFRILKIIILDYLYCSNVYNNKNNFKDLLCSQFKPQIIEIKSMNSLHYDVLQTFFEKKKSNKKNLDNFFEIQIPLLNKTFNLLLLSILPLTQKPQQKKIENSSVKPAFLNQRSKTIKFKNQFNTLYEIHENTQCLNFQLNQNKILELLPSQYKQHALRPSGNAPRETFPSGKFQIIKKNYFQAVETQFFIRFFLPFLNSEIVDCIASNSKIQNKQSTSFKNGLLLTNLSDFFAYSLISFTTRQPAGPEGYVSSPEGPEGNPTGHRDTRSQRRPEGASKIMGLLGDFPGARRSHRQFQKTFKKLKTQRLKSQKPIVVKKFFFTTVNPEPFTPKKNIKQKSNSLLFFPFSITKKHLINYVSKKNFSHRTNFNVILQKKDGTHSSKYNLNPIKVCLAQNILGSLKINSFNPILNEFLLKEAPYFKFKNMKPMGAFIRSGEEVGLNQIVMNSGQLIAKTRQKLLFRRAATYLLNKPSILHVKHGELISQKQRLYSVFYNQSKTGDIVQGIPKIEEIFEARKKSKYRLNQLSIFSKDFLFFEKKISIYLQNLQKSVVNNIQRIYCGQGVHISDKHIEIIVRQMTSNVLIIEPGQTGLLCGEVVALQWISRINSTVFSNPIIYEPLLMGMTKTCLETSSFLSAASFQETTHILGRAALQNQIDFIRGLKQNVILGNLIPIGTGCF